MRRCECGGTTTVRETRLTQVSVLGGLVEGRRRRYQCLACKRRFSSIEIPTTEEGRRGAPITVITGSAAERATAAFAALREFTTATA